MSGNYNSSNNDIVDEIKSRCNIVDVIGRVVTLKKAGSTYKGLCHFHNEKTPSFVVYETTQTYKCFGCNEGGDVINFVQKYYHHDFKDAVEMLAKEYGIEVNFSQAGSQKNAEFYEINRKAAIFFYKALREKKNPAYPYMRNRGISDETLRSFGIGYADDEWTSLVDYMKTQEVSPEKLVEVGLASEKTGRYYDKFRGRVIFPIHNTAEKVIGFGGRILGDGSPKYLNSSDSSAFKKGNNLYALNVTKDYVHKEDSIILVEGYMDVISLYQAGVRNVSASLGTALTENQAKLIKRYTSNVILSYDADNAGKTAALRGLDILYGEDISARVLVVNDGKDPDEFIKAQGREAYLELAKNALSFGDFKLSKAKSKYNMSDERQKLAYLRDAVKILRGMKPIEADMYIGKLAADTGISEMAIRQEYDNSSAGNNSFRPSGQDNPQTAVSGMTEVEQDLIKLMLIDSEYAIIPGDIKDDLFRDSAGSSIYNAIKSIDKGERPLDINKLNDLLDINSSDALRRINDRVIPGDKEEQIFNDCIRHIRADKLRREDLEIRRILQYPADEQSPEELNQLMKRQMEIQKILKG
mgnify:FL=1